MNVCRIYLNFISFGKIFKKKKIKHKKVIEM